MIRLASAVGNTAGCSLREIISNFELISFELNHQMGTWLRSHARSDKQFWTALSHEQVRSVGSQEISLLIEVFPAIFHPALIVR